ncbi:hypothetical protein ABZY90_31250 [Streptomyces sp. NPDC006422]|uniref:hypothetical protein n=1 Tax=unclassified Streptomyces TaxID=2593676 RepID=UPI0033B9570F
MSWHATDGRAASCLAAQSRLAEHAEESRSGGEPLRGSSPDIAARYAEVFARLMAELADATVAPPLPNPRWVRWDHTDAGTWPALDFRRLRGAEPSLA